MPAQWYSVFSLCSLGLTHHYFCKTFHVSCMSLLIFISIWFWTYQWTTHLPCLVTFYVPFFSSLVSAAVVNNMTKLPWRRKGFIPLYSLRSFTEGNQGRTQGRSLKQTSRRNAASWLALWLLSTPFLIQPKHTPLGVASHTPINQNNLSQTWPQIWWRQLFI